MFKDLLLNLLQVVRGGRPIFVVLFVRVKIRIHLLHQRDLASLLLVDKDESAKSLYKNLLQVALLAIDLEITGRHSVLLHQVAVVLNQIFHGLIVLAH